MIYRLTREYRGAEIRYRLLHYDQVLGGVIVRPEGDSIAILGRVSQPSDAKALNTMWRHFGIEKRVRIEDGEVRVSSPSSSEHNYLSP